MSVLYQVLYTHQKQKKHKTWQDGFLRVYEKNNKGVLLSDESKSLDSFFVRSSQLETDEELESDRYLITVDCLQIEKDGEKNVKTALKEDNGNEPTLLTSYANCFQSTRKSQKPFQPVYNKQLKQTSNEVSRQALSKIDIENVIKTEPDNPVHFTPKRRKFSNFADYRHIGGEALLGREESQYESLRSTTTKLAAHGDAKRTTDHLLALFTDDGNEKLTCIDTDNSTEFSGLASKNKRGQETSRVLDETGLVVKSGTAKKHVNIDQFESMAHVCKKSRTCATAEGVGNLLPGINGRVGQYQRTAVGLVFPAKESVILSPMPKRKIKIPPSFQSVLEYKQIFKSILKEHINILLFDASARYHNAMSSVDTSSLQERNANASNNDGPSCQHGLAKLKSVRKEGKNNGRLFYVCSQTDNTQCNYFKWADQVDSPSNSAASTKHVPAINSFQSLTTYLSSCGIQLYCNVTFLRKSNFFKGKGKHKNNFQSQSNQKQLYVVLPFKKSSSTYNKEDLWVISKSLQFTPADTFIAQSVFYGPNSSCELEIAPLAAYYTSNWQNEENCFAIQVSNISTELTCIENLNNYLNQLDVPVLSHMLKHSQEPTKQNVANNRFDLSCLPIEDIENITGEVTRKFSLNQDQTRALKEISNMFVVDGNKFITLVHGVFGAGKSYLLATVVLFLVELFQLIETRFDLQIKLKLVISSTTNVAVDRVLQTLMDFGYEEFVRVGSLKKIAKRVLPFSIHASDNDDHELKELNELMKMETTVEEKGYIKKAIDHHKLGINRNKLNNVAVVGVTCAACVFPYLQNLTFQVQLLDECSQMLEPLSMLPIARFKCERLVLVGDPKQLSPTIQGSEACHESSLEMTLFERLQHLRYEPVMLKTQYRCHPFISHVSSKMFYDGVLKDGVDVMERAPLLDHLPTLSFCDVPDGCEECQSHGSYMNVKEAEVITNLLLLFIQAGIKGNAVGVITQYKSQVAQISMLLAQSSMSPAELKAIQISTVDAFQGAEKEIILLSCVRTKYIGFIDCVRRTNVALSRAKRHLIIIGYYGLLKSNPVWNGVLMCFQEKNGVFEKSHVFLKRLVREEHGNGTDATAGNIVL